MRVEVTADDIARGTLRSCVSCPVALAIMRALRECGYPYVSVTVGPRDADMYVRSGYGDDETLAATVALPDCVAPFILRYDAEMPVEPFGFDMTMLTMPELAHV